MNVELEEIKQKVRNYLNKKYIELESQYFILLSLTEDLKFEIFEEDDLIEPEDDEEDFSEFEDDLEEPEDNLGKNEEEEDLDSLDLEEEISEPEFEDIPEPPKVIESKVVEGKSKVAAEIINNVQKQPNHSIKIKQRFAKKKDEKTEN